ncbi:uroporphyrinogen-III synthase [Tundrisphaera sp. TA3]|uniref:uroporphyrinogen-III synthase n=1 Tax=Tundrisphaera sp. TA3 TaxID=3435775 RepID=UPI003EBB4F96
MMSDPDATAFAGLRVAAFEARMAGPMAALIAKHGGVPVEAPALREVPLGDDPGVAAFAGRLIAGDFDVVLFETGVGVRLLAEAIASRGEGDAWLAALGRVKVVARGPKPAAALRGLGARVDLQVPEPNTWRETLALLDAHLPVDGLGVAVQEYGQPNLAEIEGLRRRGALVTRVPIYRYALPEDTGPLRRAIAEIVAGRVGAALFTSAQQATHLIQVAAEMGREADLRAALGRVAVVGSIGPSTSGRLRDLGLPVDIEPEHPKMGQLVSAVAAGWRRVGKVGTAGNPLADGR